MSANQEAEIEIRELQRKLDEALIEIDRLVRQVETAYGEGYDRGKADARN